MNIKKFVSSLFVFTFVLSTLMFSTQKTEAAQVFPIGCSSAIGYSIINGSPCNGTSVATNSMVGCPTVLGFSTVNGMACSGTNEALLYLGGCTSIYNYSIDTGAACNGTGLVTLFPTYPTYPTETPGLPTTGTEGITLRNILILLSLGLVVVGSTTYIVKRYSKIS